MPVADEPRRPEMSLESALKEVDCQCHGFRPDGVLLVGEEPDLEIFVQLLQTIPQQQGLAYRHIDVAFPVKDEHGAIQAFHP